MSIVSSEVDLVRVLVNDPSDGSGNPRPVDPDNPLPCFTSQIISDFLCLHDDGGDDPYGRIYMTAADLARSRAAKEANFAKSRSIGGTYTEDARETAKNWLKVSEQYQKIAVERPEVVIAQLNYADNPFTEPLILQRILVENSIDLAVF